MLTRIVQRRSKTLRYSEKASIARGTGGIAPSPMDEINVGHG